MVDFDYVIVGAEAAGCVLASRLSEDPGHQVLLSTAALIRTPAVCPVQVAGNTQAPAMAVAWIAADLIREDS